MTEMLTLKFLSLLGQGVRNGAGTGVLGGKVN